MDHANHPLRYDKPDEFLDGMMGSLFTDRETRIPANPVKAEDRFGVHAALLQAAVIEVDGAYRLKWALFYVSELVDLLSAFNLEHIGIYRLEIAGLIEDVQAERWLASSSGVPGSWMYRVRRPATFLQDVMAADAKWRLTGE